MIDAEAQANLAHVSPGSKPWRWDPRERNFSHKRFYGTAPTLPSHGLNRPRRIVENQYATLRCGAYSAAVSNGYLRNVRFHPDWQAIKIGQQQGRPVDGNGSEPRACMNSLRDNGSLPFDAASVHLSTHTTRETIDPYNYPATADDMAQNNRITAYLGVDDVHDFSTTFAGRSSAHITHPPAPARSSMPSAVGSKNGPSLRKASSRTSTRPSRAGTRTSSLTGPTSTARPTSSRRIHTAMTSAIEATTTSPARL